MIRFNAVSAGAYWERPLVLPLGQRRVAGREPPSEPRSAGQPGYLGESLVHLHHHRAPISATQPTDLLLTDIRAMGTQATRDIPATPVLRAMDTQATRVSPLTPVPRRQATPDIRPIPDPRAMGIQAPRNIPPTLVLRGMDLQAIRHILPTPGPRPMDTRADRHTLPIPVPVMDTPWLVTGIFPPQPARLAALRWRQPTHRPCRQAPAVIRAVLRSRSCTPASSCLIANKSRTAPAKPCSSLRTMRMSAPPPS